MSDGICKWREEFESSDHVAIYQYELYKNKSGEYGNSDTYRLWLGFLEAKKQDAEKIKELEINAIEKCTEYERMFRQEKHKTKTLQQENDLLKKQVDLMRDVLELIKTEACYPCSYNANTALAAIKEIK